MDSTIARDFLEQFQMRNTVEVAIVVGNSKTSGSKYENSSSNKYDGN